MGADFSAIQYSPGSSPFRIVMASSDLLKVPDPDSRSQPLAAFAPRLPLAFR